MSAGCILSYDTVVGPSTVLKPGTRVTVAGPRHMRNDSECSNDSEDTRCSDPDNISETDVLGSDHWGVIYQSDEDSDGSSGDEDEQRAEFNRKWYVRHPDCCEFDEISDSSDSTPVPSEPEQDSEIGFYGEVCDSFKAGYAIQKDIDNVLIEVNASKHAYNISVADQLMHSTRALLELCPEVKEFPKYVQYFGPMFMKLAKDRDSQMVILDEIETWALERCRVQDAQRILHILYNDDVLEESNILEWYEGAGDDVKSSVAKFIVWLKEAEEESSESD